MGPDLDYARRKGNELGKKYLAQLIKKYDLYDIDDPKWNVMFKLPNAEKRWKRAKANFIKSVEELFVKDACNGF